MSSITSDADKYFVGIDVGTGSARAALVNAIGQVKSTHVVTIQTWNPKSDHYEQSSDDIWSAVCQCVKTVTKNIPKDHIIGLGFDATCSLVALDSNDLPLSLSTTGKNDQNIILWMDHRAGEEARLINDTGHDLLRFVGGQVSLEMQAPKLLWIKNNLPEIWSKASRFFDLPDYLTFRCTGSDVRSLCSVVCKWNFDAANNQWSSDFMSLIGIHELIEGESKIGANILAPGSPIRGGLSKQAADELDLLPGTAVGVSLIDAHAGAAALFGCSAEGVNSDVTSKLAIICGTSSCHMSLVRQPIYVDGVWGPYAGAVYPGTYLHEAGQSATGLLIDFVINSHPAYYRLIELSGEKHPQSFLNETLQELASGRIEELTREIHVWPDYHGNRSPLADSSMRGMVCGLSMSNDINNLAIHYLATLQSLAYGTRQILDALQRQGRQQFNSLSICGGLSKNPLFVQTHADVCAMPVLLAVESEMVLIGAASLGACASGYFGSLEDASKHMAGKAHVVWPQTTKQNYHDRKYKVFLKMMSDQREYVQLMKA